MSHWLKKKKKDASKKTKQAAKKPHATPNKTDYWALLVWRQELMSPSTDRAQFQCVTTNIPFVPLRVYVCVEMGREKTWGVFH